MRVCRYAVLIALAVMMLSFSFLTGARAEEESYYLVLFSYGGPGGQARDAHTFAAFVKVDSDSGAESVSVNSISWLPETLDPRLLRRPEAGVNLTLEDTLKLAADRNLRVTAWGPYRIKRELYDRAMAQIKQLNAGTIAYKALDTRFRGGGVSNCIHAVSDVAEAPLLDTGTAYGVSATALVRDHFNPWIVEKVQDHSRLKKLLGLQRYSIDYRD